MYIIFVSNVGESNSSETVNIDEEVIVEDDRNACHESDRELENELNILDNTFVNGIDIANIEVILGDPENSVSVTLLLDQVNDSDIQSAILKGLLYLISI